MRKFPATWVTLFTLMLIPLTAQAQEPEAGTIAEKVPCGPGGRYSYACYLPSHYSSNQSWPILYCFSPGADGLSFVNFFKDACEDAGWILVASNDSKNGPLQNTAIREFWKDTRKRFNIDSEYNYATGFSGGARVAWWFSTQEEFHPSGFAGLIQIGAGTSSGSSSIPDSRVGIWMMCGKEDFNRKELESLEKRLKKEERDHHLEIFPGEHVMPDSKLGAEAVRWHVKRAEEERLKKIRDQITMARKQIATDPVVSWTAVEKLLERQDLPGKEQKEAEGLRREIIADETAVAAIRDAALSRAEDLEADDPYGAFRLLDQWLQDFGKSEAGLVQERLNALKENDAVKQELEAAEALAKVDRYADGKDPAKYADKIQRRFEKIEKQFPGTSAAAEARKRINTLPSPD